MKRWFIGLIFVICTTILSGCLYPQEKRQQLDQLPTHIAQVQSAVDEYKKRNHMVPYRYKEDEIMLTTKYLVDFEALKGYGTGIPPTAFEKGGNYLYLYTDVEKKPTVRVMDLRIHEQIRIVQPLVQEYLKEKKQLPVKEKVDVQYATIDFNKLRINPVTIPSPYHAQTSLELLVDQKGRVFVDYRPEVMQMIQEAKNKPSENQDLRTWVSLQSFFVPAYSPPMKYKNNEPVLEVVAP
ncbi:hypothetical protein [Thermoflavimicrobium dichotomicum]|uniref:Uncharacterized protein n=1 Tax=Thermoflavimicrobium dichotomicum TaxID=46223 RepID=A0A1I3SJX9_9BACL|nr:hypothetical protein [Thermoflavimicrobium dichotomicum]SFJ57737.1 hypothetical protein SAMN05421852_11324 [Thermoflavimicrobium dichotomicum]